MYSIADEYDPFVVLLEDLSARTGDHPFTVKLTRDENAIMEVSLWTAQNSNAYLLSRLVSFVRG